AARKRGFYHKVSSTKHYGPSEIKLRIAMPFHQNRRTRRPKTISSQGVIGHVVLGFGSRWTPNGPNEIGIDGFIELFDPNSHQSLGLNLAVQSKVVNSICKNPDPTFEYFCNPNDVEYWLTTNIPLILIVSCPDSQEGYWISIKEYFKNWTHGKRAS